MWLGQSLLYTVLLRFVALSKSGCPLSGSRLARETGAHWFDSMLRGIYPFALTVGLSRPIYQ